MDHFYKFCSITLLPLFYTLRERVRAQMNEPSFVVDIILLAFFVFLTLYLWSRCIRHIQEISIQLLFVLIGVALALTSSHFGLTMWEVMAQKYPGWYGSIGSWLMTSFFGGVGSWVMTSTYVGRTALTYWNNATTAPFQ